MPAASPAHHTGGRRRGWGVTCCSSALPGSSAGMPRTICVPSIRCLGPPSGTVENSHYPACSALMNLSMRPSVRTR
jgi:hypothetical protein